MKKLIFKIVSIPLIFAAIPFTIYEVTENTDPVFADTFYGGMKIKNERLRTAQGKKVVIIGGSNVAFSIQSSLMEAYLDDYDSVVNFGLYANLGTKVMLDMAKPYINSGDLVVIQPEQNEQSMSMYFNGEATWYLIDEDPSLKDLIPEENQDELFWSYSSYAAKKFEYTVNGKPTLDGVYQKSSFDDLGDIVYQRPENIMVDGFDSSTPIAFSESYLNDDFISYLNDYSKEMNERGANTVFSFCPMNELSVFNKTEFNDYLLMLKNKLEFPIAGLNDSMIVDNTITSECKVSEAIMEANWFYDSNFHPNTYGSLYFSYQLLNRINEYLDNSVTLSYDALYKPELKDYKDDGNAKSNGVFKYTEVLSNDTPVGISIKGLDDSQDTLKIVDIPQYIDSLPVIKIDNYAFKNKTNIERINIPSTLTTLGNGGFEGLSNLTTLVVNVVKPSSLRIANGYLYSSPNVTIYVPDESVDQYKLDYYWSKYQNIIKGKSQL